MKKTATPAKLAAKKKSGPPNAFADPKGRLTGEAKGGRHLKLTSVAELPRKEVQAWVRTAAKLARG